MMDEIFLVVAKNTQDTKSTTPTFVELASGIVMCKQGATPQSTGLISVCSAAICRVAACSAARNCSTRSVSSGETQSKNECRSGPD